MHGIGVHAGDYDNDGANDLRLRSTNGILAISTMRRMAL